LLLLAHDPRHGDRLARVTGRKPVRAGRERHEPTAFRAIAGLTDRPRTVMAERRLPE